MAAWLPRLQGRVQRAWAWEASECQLVERSACVETVAPQSCSCPTPLPCPALSCSLDVGLRTLLAAAAARAAAAAKAGSAAGGGAADAGLGGGWSERAAARRWGQVRMLVDFHKAHRCVLVWLAQWHHSTMPSLAASLERPASAMLPVAGVCCWSDGGRRRMRCCAARAPRPLRQATFTLLPAREKARAPLGASARRRRRPSPNRRRRRPCRPPSLVDVRDLLWQALDRDSAAAVGRPERRSRQLLRLTGSGHKKCMCLQLFLDLTRCFTPNCWDHES